MIGEYIERKLFVEKAPQAIHYIGAVPYGERSGLVAEVYDQMMRDFQLVPPITLHSSVPSLLAGVWTAVRESVVAGPASRVEREAAIAAVSRINTCSFCVDVHTIALRGAGEHDVASAVARGEDDKIADPQLRSLVKWAAATRTPHAKILHNPPLSDPDAAQIIGSVLMFHYINRPVNVFLDESPLSLLPPMMRSFKNVAGRIAGSVIGSRTLANTPAPGASLSLLPEAPLPEEFQWATSNPYVAGAWARFAAVVEEAGRQSLPEEVRELVLSHTKAWNGEEMPLSRSWVEDAIISVSEEHKPAARLALLTALASHQVDQGMVEAFQRRQTEETEIVKAVAWASLAAVRRISQWLQAPSSRKVERMQARE